MTSESTIRVFVGATILAVIAIGGFFRGRAAAASKERVSRQAEGWPILILLRLAGLSVWLATIVYLIDPGWMRWSSLALPIGLRWAGVGMSVLAVPLLAWMFRSLGHNVTDTVVVRQAATLVQHGPYRWIRHPLYSFAFLFFGGISLAAANWFLMLAIGLTTVILRLRTQAEEAKLIERFGDDYRRYMTKTGRFLPHL